MKFEHFHKFKCLYKYCFIFIRFSLCRNDTYWSKVLGVKVFLLSLEVKKRNPVLGITNFTLSVLREMSFMQLNIRANLLCPKFGYLSLKCCKKSYCAENDTVAVTFNVVYWNLKFKNWIRFTLFCFSTLYLERNANKISTNTHLCFLMFS